MQKNGFTLFELLIVIVIVGILFGAMVPILNVSRQDARVAKAQSELDSIKTAAMMLHHDTGEWPPDSTTGSDFITNDSTFPGWAGPYLDEWKDDPWGSPYEIWTSGTERRVRSLGADNAVGGTGYNADIDLIITPSF
jgi:general secretion pathway protein G